MLLQVCKTSVSYETSPKVTRQSLQSERFARDFLQKSHVKVSKARLPPKVKREAHSPNANPNVTAKKTADLFILHTSTSHVSTRFFATAHESATSCFHQKASPNQRQRHSAPPANGCGRRRTVAVAQTTSREQGSTSRPPELNENPSLRIREKTILKNNNMYIYIVDYS